MSLLKDEAFQQDVYQEVERARAKFPGARHQTVALVEEVGELAQAMLEHGSGSERVREEAVQVAAMAQRVAVDGDDDFKEAT